MRLQDVLHPYLDDIDTVVEWHAGSISVEPYLNLPDGVAYQRRTGTDQDVDDRRDGDRHVLEIAILGPDLARHGPESHALGVIGRLRPGDRAAILFGYEIGALPFHRLLDDLTAADAQVLQVSALDYDHIHAAAIVAVSDRLLVPRDLLGEPVAAGDDLSDPAFIRIANEFVFTDFAARNLRARLYRTVADDGGTSAEPGEQAERDLRHARELANQARTDAEHAKAEAERIAASTSYRLGLTLVETARGRRRITSLPGSLVRVWRGSGNRGPAASPGSSSPGRLRGGVSADPLRRSSALAATSDVLLTGGSEDRLFLANSGVAIGARTTPVILGIVTDPTAGAFAHDAIVNRVTPNDALLVLERCEPDLVLVEAAACAPSHPWAFAGGGASVDRARVLLDLVDRARASGRPAVLIRDVRSAAHVGLVALEDRFDLVVDADHGTDGEPGWSRGVQLARFNPLGGRSMRDGGPLFIGGLDPHTRLRERSLLISTLAAAGDHGLDICLEADAPPGWDEIPADLREKVRGRIAWQDLPSRYRRTSLVIANPFAARGPARTVDVRTLEQLACGARILSGPNDALDTLAGAHVTAIPEDGDPAGVLTTALQQGVPDHAAMRRLLRALFLDHASSIKLARLIRALALDVRSSTNRSSTALVSVGADADVPRLVESILDQIQPPTAVLLALGDGATWPGTADEALTSRGVEVHATSARSGDRDWPEDDGGPTHEWLAFWPTGRPIAPTYLLDLLVGGEMSGADAIAYQPQGNHRFVETLDLASSIVRRDRLREIGGWRRADLDDPTGHASWQGLGWRLLSVGPEDIR